MNVSSPPAPPYALGDLTPEKFLSEYWQQQPLVIRAALPDFSSPLAPEELAGLALDPGVESRLVLEEGGAEPWELRHGPFSENDFRALPETHWTLLVQAVDQLLPSVERLLDHFRFLPRWRLGDVMVSYAPRGGSVGAHIDHYDVFLVQGKGRRRWQFSRAPVEDERIVPDLDVRILADFQPDEEVVLEPGDLLYLPPRVAHHGTSESADCMTFSVGLRAPSHAEILRGYARACAERLTESDRYTDPDLAPAGEHFGEIPEAPRAQVRRVIRRAAEDDDAIDRWFGEHLTAPPHGDALLPPESAPSAEEIAESVRAGVGLRPTPGARLAYFTEQDGSAALFAGGERYELAPPLAFAAPLLADRRRIAAERLRPHLGNEAFTELLARLVADGVFEEGPQTEDGGPQE